MAQSVYRITAALILVLMLAGVFVSIYPGGCDTLIPAETGDFPMKCHWAFVATTVLFLVGAVAALASLMLKTLEGRRVAAVGILLLLVAIAVMPSPLGIGICASSGDASMTLCMVDGGGMDCHTTAPIVWAICACAAIIAIFQFIKADPAAVKKPRLNDDL
jgi:hypothetical protein